MIFTEQSEKPIRVLHILTGLTNGGAESFIMNMYRHMDRDKVQFDFLLRSDDNIYAEELNKMGSRVYKTASFPKHFIKNAQETDTFFKTHDYDVIHVHANALLYTFALSCAKRRGVTCRIIHSHNAGMAHMQLLPIHNMNKRRINNLATDFFSCSETAGKWMFDRNFTVVHNAIDLSAFAYNPQKRIQIRKKFGIGENELVIGHIGRFVGQKNQSFLVDILAEVVKKKTDTKLILVGDGEQKTAIEKKVENMGLLDKVIFFGAQKDVTDIVNAFDLFVFPSKFEGLGIVAVEAQANGLKVICSEMVPDQVLFNSAMCKLPLSAGPVCWAEHILGADTQRLHLTSQIQAAGYDVKQEAKKLQDFYIVKGTNNTEKRQ